MDNENEKEMIEEIDGMRQMLRGVLQSSDLLSDSDTKSSLTLERRDPPGVLRPKS